MNRPNGQVPPQCARCNKPIFDGTIFKVKDQLFHNSCLQCVVCQEQLNGFCFAKGIDIYCKGDFTRNTIWVSNGFDPAQDRRSVGPDLGANCLQRLSADTKLATCKEKAQAVPITTATDISELFGAKCCSCSGIIAPTESARFANGNVYHSGCFTCVVCCRAVKTGDYFYIRHDHKIICGTDYNLQFGSMMAAASESDSDEEMVSSSRRRRTCINDLQLRMLLETYQSNQRPSRHMMEKLSRKIGLRVKVVQIWFQNRRAKDKHLVPGTEQITQGLSSYGDRKIDYTDCAKNKSTRTECLNSVEAYHHDNTREKQETTYQLYCPLDYLLPDSMPPNVELSSTDLQNGEVITTELKDTQNIPYLTHAFGHPNFDRMAENSYTAVPL